MTDDIAALRQQYLANARTPLRIWALIVAALSLAGVVLLLGWLEPSLWIVVFTFWPASAVTFASRLGTYRSVRDLEDWVQGRLWVGLNGMRPRRNADGLLVVGDEEWTYSRVERADGWVPRHELVADVAVARHRVREPYEIALTASGAALRLRWPLPPRTR